MSSTFFTQPYVDGNLLSFSLYLKSHLNPAPVVRLSLLDSLPRSCNKFQGILTYLQQEKYISFGAISKKNIKS
jgi:hypothetical protein